MSPIVERVRPFEIRKRYLMQEVLARLENEDLVIIEFPIGHVGRSLAHSAVIRIARRYGSGRVTYSAFDLGDGTLEAHFSRGENWE